MAEGIAQRLKRAEGITAAMSSPWSRPPPRGAVWVDIRAPCPVRPCPLISLPTRDAGPEDERADAAQRLWTVLTRAVPGPARAEPATLLAAHAYLRGDGALASIALEVAQDANPAHVLAHLLNLAIQKGIPPTQLRRMLLSAVTTHP